ncbi:MAG TPA: MATE family efflux transporter [bacterium]|nr:MATE family efflux transporter [bacterium]
MSERIIEPVNPVPGEAEPITPPSVTPQSETREVYRSILRMGIPSMVGFAALHLYNVVDMFWVSRLGAEQVAGVAIFAAFYWVLSSINMIAGAGSTAIIARRYGEQDMERTRTAIVEAFILKIATAAVSAVIGYLLTPWMVRLLGATGDVERYAISYGRVMFLGLVFNFPVWTVFTALRGIDQPRPAMWIMLASTGLNALLNPIMIFGWGPIPALGVAGSAWASLIGFGMTTIVGLAMFFAGAFHVRLTWAAVRQASQRTMWQMLKIGMPTGVSSISFSLARLVITPMITHFGAPYVAIYGAGSRVLELTIIVVVGLELGLSPLIGHLLGRGDKQRAYVTAEKAIALAAGLMLTMGIGMALLAGPITRIFFADSSYEPLGVAFFRIMAIAGPFIGAFLMMEAAFSGAGDTVPVMVVGIIHAWVFQVPLIWFLSHGLGVGPNGIWWGFAGSEALSSVFYFWWFSRKRWIHRQV